MFLLPFIISHLIIVAVFPSISNTIQSTLILSFIYLTIFSLIRYFKNKFQCEDHYYEAVWLIDEKEEFLSEFKINFKKRKKKKEVISSFTRGFSIGSLFVDGGVSALIASGTGKVVNSSFDYSNKKDKQILKDYDLQINYHKSAIEEEGKKFKIEMFVFACYMVLMSIYLISFHL